MGYWKDMIFFTEVREFTINTGFAFNEGLNSWGGGKTAQPDDHGA